MTRAMLGIQLAVEASMMQAGEAMLTVAAARAPEIDEEYAELNAEAGQAPLVSRSGDRSDDSDGRVRFIKPESTYLKNAVADPANILAVGQSVMVGNRAYLNAATHFKYKNKAPRGGQITNEVGPYFSMFEGGTAGAAVEGGITTFTVMPRGDYPLRPGEGPDGTKTQMVKSVSARAMFSPLYLQQAAIAVIERALAAVGPSRGNS
jgi:hypothetical protein